MVRSPLPRCLRGYTYIGLLFLVFMVGMGLSVASHWWHMEAKRAREQELLFVGEEFRKAIASYHATAVGTPQYPKSLEDLVEDNRLPTPIRHLRRVYIDPVTGEAGWELIKEQDRIIGVNSRSKEVPIKVAGFPERYEEFSAATTYTQWRFVHRVTAKSSPGDPSTPTPGNQPLTQPPRAQGNRPSSRLRGEHRGRDEEFGQQAACSSSGVPMQRNARAASEGGMNQRFIRAIVLAVTLAASFHAYSQSSITPTEELAEDRVGRTYWARPGLNDTSVDFFQDPALRDRVPVYKKTRFSISAIEVLGESPNAQVIYRVRFDGKREAFIGLSAFDHSLYRELAPNQVMTAPANSPIGVAPHLWIFERSSIFATDPDVIWERIKNEGPRTFRPIKAKPRERKADIPRRPK